MFGREPSFVTRPDVRVHVESAPLHIRGVTGVNSAIVNGIFDPTEELSCGQPVYVKRGDGGKCIHFWSADGDWIVTDIASKGKDGTGWASLKHSGRLEAASVMSDWRVNDGKTFVTQPGVRLHVESKTEALSKANVAAEDLKRLDKKRGFIKVHRYLVSNSSRLPPDMDFVALCPNYFCNVIQALSSPLQPPTSGTEACDPASNKLVSNANLPFGCKSSNEHGGLQCALHLFIRRALATKSSLDVCSVVEALTSWIVQCGVDVCARDNIPLSGRTALHQVAVSGSELSLALVDALLAANASRDAVQRLLDMQDGAGLSALEIAVDQGNVAFAAKLISKGATFRKDFLKSKKDDSEQWQPVVDAVMQQSQEQQLESFLLEIFGVLPEFIADPHHLEQDEDVERIKQGCFKPSSPPPLKSVEREDAAFACLMRSIALTRFPRHCPLVIESRRGLRKYLKMLSGSPDSDFNSSDTPTAENGPIRAHRWVLIVGSHIAYAQNKPFVVHALLDQLKKLQPEQELNTSDSKILQLASDGLQDSATTASQLFGEPDRSSVMHDAILKSLSEQQRKPLERLLKLIGLQRQKDVGVKMFSAAQDQQFFRENGMKDSIVERVQNFVFAGNPGWGKTVVARLYADILQVSGIRNGNTFVEMSAAKALKMGSKAFADEMKKLAADRSKTGPDAVDLPAGKFLVNDCVEVMMNKKRINAKIVATPASKISLPGQPQTYDVEYEDGRKDSVAPDCISRPSAGQKQGGVLFIDEVYDLDPAKNPEGKLILAEIMRIAEDYRDTVSVILAGYKDDIDNKIFSFNIGEALCAARRNY